MATRRGVLKLVGGGVVLAAVAGGGWYAMNGPSQAARSPWRDAGKPEELRRRLLSYALLAPSPHNLQPWMVRLDGEDALTLYCDLDRRLPATDPFDRQTVIGCGTFLEVLSIAAAHEGYAADITPFPEGEPTPRLDARPVAHVRLRANGAEPDPTFAHVLTRVTNRNVYTDRVPDGDTLTAIVTAGAAHGAVVRATTDAERVAQLRDHVWRGWMIENHTSATHAESVAAMRLGKSEVEQHRDGIVFEGQFMEAAKLVGYLDHKSLADPDSGLSKQGEEMWKAKADSAKGFVWLLHENTRADQLAAGRAYTRLTLKIAELGLAVHPWSHTLQEFPEMADLYREAHELMGEGRTVQMLVRLGYAAPTIHAPRRELGAHLMT